jgi:glycosyltransferase involved in cell wall biosynthesis
LSGGPSGPGAAPEISFVMPCFNEQDVVGYVAPQLCDAFLRAGHAFELIAVDNGSRDDTGKILAKLRDEGRPIRIVRVETNEGYGNGVLRGFEAARTPWIGIIPADGQVDADDVVKLFEAVRTMRGRALGKVRRRFRMDGPLRKLVSVAYNVFVWLLWPRLGSIDVNGSPKILQREYLDLLDLKSKRWFLDPEIMVKAHYLGVRVLEMNVFARMRGNGLSHVRASTCVEFFAQLLRFRFSAEMRRWRRERVGSATAPNASA